MSIGSNIPSLQVTDTALVVTIGGRTEKLEKSKFDVIGWLFGQNVGIQLDYMEKGKPVTKWVYIKKSEVERFNTNNPVESKSAEGPGHKFVNKLISLYRDNKNTTQVLLDKPGVARLTGQSVFVLSSSDHTNLKSFLSKYGLKLPAGYAPGAILGQDARAHFINGLEKANPNKNENDWKIIHHQIDKYFGDLSDEAQMTVNPMGPKAAAPPKGEITPNPLRETRSAPSPTPSPENDQVEQRAEDNPSEEISYNPNYVRSSLNSERRSELLRQFDLTGASVEDLKRKFTSHTDWASTTKKNTNYQHFHQVVYLLEGMIPIEVKGQAKPKPKFENGLAVMTKLCAVADALKPEDKAKLNAFLNKVRGSHELNVLIASLQLHLSPSAAQ